MATKDSYFSRKIKANNICEENGRHVETAMHLLCFCERSKEGLLERWVTICWGIWKSQNEVKHGGKRLPGSIIVRNSVKLLEDFLSANVKMNRPISDAQISASWKPPPPGYFKINEDGALFTKSKQSGVGVIVHDEEGNVVTAMCRKLDLPLSALETEAKALEIGVTFAEEEGLRDVVFESDSQLTIKAIHSTGEAA
nr:uncharacterized protein LOC111996113 [Quercus suber]